MGVSHSSEKFARNDLVKKSVLGMMDPIAVAAASEAFGHDVVDAERLRGNTELGFFHLVVGPEHAEEAYRLWTCDPPRFDTESGIPILTVRLREDPGDNIENVVFEMSNWMFRAGGIFINKHDPFFTCYFEGQDEANGRINFQFKRRDAPYGSMLMYVRAVADPRDPIYTTTLTIQGASLHEVMTVTLPRIYPPEAYVYAFPSLTPMDKPMMYAIDRVRPHLLPRFRDGRLMADLTELFGDDEDANMDRATRVMRIFGQKLTARETIGMITGEDLELCRVDAYTEGLAEASDEDIDGVLDRTVFFSTYADAVGYRRRTDHPSFEVQVVPPQR